MVQSKIFSREQLRCLRVNILITALAWLIVFTSLAGGTGKLDLFNGNSNSNSSAKDTLNLLVDNKTTHEMSNGKDGIPERFKLYDLNSDGEISEWEMKDAVRDFKEQDTPYSHQEMTAFLDYFFKEW